MKTGLSFGIVANSKTRVRCIFCGVFIPKANKCIEQHANGSKHRENIELMTENGITYNDESLHCKACKRTLDDEESVSTHIEAEDHSTWLATLDDLIDGEFVNVNDYLATDSDNVYCEVCANVFPFSLQNIEEHVNSFSHRVKVTDKLKPLNAIFPVDNDDELWCKICNTYINNNVQSVLQHIDDDQEHIEWFSEIEDLIEDQDLNIESFLSEENELNAFCNKCQVPVLCNTTSIEQHVNSTAHLNQFS